MMLTTRRPHCACCAWQRRFPAACRRHVRAELLPFCLRFFLQVSGSVGRALRSAPRHSALCRGTAHARSEASRLAHHARFCAARVLYRLRVVRLALRCLGAPAASLFLTIGASCVPGRRWSNIAGQNGGSAADDNAWLLCDIFAPVWLRDVLRYLFLQRSPKR